ncbi:MAG: RsmD family RNA methyltransferase, partial [Bacteroidota bacterium]
MPHTRPTTDMAREGLFNILAHRINWQEVRSLDLFGGTGAI